jgi:hypothetical protein
LLIEVLDFGRKCPDHSNMTKTTSDPMTGFIPPVSEGTADKIASRRALQDHLADQGDELLPSAAATVIDNDNIDVDDSDYRRQLDELAAGIDRIAADMKVVAGDWAAAAARNKAIEIYRADNSLQAAGCDAGFIEPETNHDPAPKPSTGFAIAKTSRRIRKPPFTRLSAIEREIRRVSDGAAIGKLLHEAKLILGHGSFSSWLKQVKIEPRTAQRYMKVTCL